MKRIFPTIILLFLLAFAIGAARAQFAQRGGIAGTVFDPAGAVVSGVRVALVQNGQSQGRQLASDAAGHFEFDNLAAGQYQLTATREGFDTANSEAITVNIGAMTTIWERFHFEFRADAFNAFNHSQWTGLNTTYPSGSSQFPFGMVNGAREARIGQMAAKLVF